METDLKKMKKDYLNIPIPDSLDFTIKKALKAAAVTPCKNAFFKGTKIAAACLTLTLSLLIAAANISPAFASALSKIPVVDKIIKVFVFNKYAINNETYEIKVEVPAIDGLDNKALTSLLNEKYLEEAKQLYDQFTKEMEELKQNGGGHLGLSSGYEIKTDSERILSVGRYTVNTVGSSSTTLEYDTIDKKNEVLITLPSLFKDDSYIQIISENIKQQMTEQYQSDNMKFYWIEEIEQTASIELFDKISRGQDFYISAEGKLVISFDKYTVAPGYMGIVEFIIPTEILPGVLVSSEYLK